MRTQGIIVGVVGLRGTVLNMACVDVLYGLLHWPFPVALAPAGLLRLCPGAGPSLRGRAQRLHRVGR